MLPDGVAIRYILPVLRMSSCSNNGAIAGHMYSQAAIEHNKHNSRDSNNISRSMIKTGSTYCGGEVIITVAGHDGVNLREKVTTY